MRTYVKKASVLFAAMLLAMVLALVGCSNSSSTETAESEAASETSATETSATESSSSESSTTSSDATASDVELQVFAANSLSKAMDEAQALYTEKTGVTFADTQYLSSGDLNAELEAGAYADIEITASKKTMDDAEEAGYIDPDTRFTMFVND